MCRDCTSRMSAFRPHLQVAADTFIDAGRWHTVRESMALAFERKLFALQQPVFMQILVNCIGEVWAVCLAGETVRVGSEGLQTDTQQGDHATGRRGFSVCGQPVQFRCEDGCVLPDLGHRQFGTFAGCVAGIDHAQKDGAGRGIVAIEISDK